MHKKSQQMAHMNYINKIDPLLTHLPMQGEMSATVMRYPREYSSLIPRVRQRIIRAAKAVGVDLAEEQVRRFDWVMTVGKLPVVSWSGDCQ